MESSLQKEIKENLLLKVLEENKTNTFIKKYFNINETTILEIYESLLNNIFSLHKNNEEIVKEILLLLKQKDGFLLDNIFSVFRPSDDDLKTLLFSRLNLKDNQLNDRGLLVLSESTFSDHKISEFFNDIKDVIEHYKLFIDSYFIRNIDIPDFIMEQAQKEAEKDVLGVYLLSEKDYSEENKQIILLNNKGKVEKRKVALLRDRYKNELNAKLKELFNSSLQSTITQEVALISQYIEQKTNGSLVKFVLNNKIKQLEVDQKIVTNKVSTGKIKSDDEVKSFLKNSKDRSTLLQSTYKKIDSLESKEQKFMGLGRETLKAKLGVITKGTMFNKQLFLTEFKTLLVSNIKNLLTHDVNYTIFEEERSLITKYFIFQKVFDTKSTKSYLQVNTNEISEGQYVVRKLDGEKTINLFVDDILKNYKKDLTDLWNRFDHFTVLQYYLYRYKKNTKVNVDFFKSLDERLENIGFEAFLIDAMPVDLVELLKIKLREGLIAQGFEGYTLQKEEDKIKGLFYKAILLLVQKTYFELLDKHVIKEGFQEKELLFLINNEEKKLLTNKYTNLIDSHKKEMYYTNVYKKFLSQKQYVEKLNESFLGNFKDFSIFYGNYIYLLSNINLFDPVYNEYDGTLHKHYLYLPPQEKSYIRQLIGQQQELGKQIQKEITSEKLKVNFLQPSVTDTINEVLINLESLSKINILYFINYILTTPSLSIDIQESFISVTIGDKVFVFFSNPSFEVFNTITIYFMNNDKEKEKIFVLVKGSFYYYLNQAFSSNINLSGVQHEFKNILEYSYHNKDVSDLTIFGSKSLNAGYCLIRENKSYNLCRFKAGSESSNLLLFRSIEKIIENIIMLGGSIEDSKVVDSTVTIGGIEYRTSILRDGDRIGITMRKNGHRSKLLLNPEELQKKYNIEFQNMSLVESGESVTLQQTYEARDIEILKRYALQDDGIFWIVGKTGSGKSVSIRNMLNYIFHEKLMKGYYTKIITLEDPIEVKNLNFTQFNAKGSELMEFIKGLKRSDPDILLIGETRSYEMLMDVLEFSQMLGVYSTLHATSIINTLFLLGQYAIRANVGMTDVINQSKVIISQKLLKTRNHKLTLEQQISDKNVVLFNEEEKAGIVDEIFKPFFSSYMSKDKKEIDLVVSGKQTINGPEEQERFDLWFKFRNDFINNWKIIKDINLKKVGGVKMYYEIGERNIFKDNLNLILRLSDRDTNLVDVERMFAMKIKLKEERAFIDFIKADLSMDEFLTLSGYLTPAIYHKLVSFDYMKDGQITELYK